MKINKPLPRVEYQQHLKDLDGKCAFCEMTSDLNIKEFYHWIWAFAAFPYRKYHTLLISKRHLLRFSDLNNDELSELAKITEELNIIYRDKRIIGQDSKYGDQLFTCWRTRQDDALKKSVSHLHLHFYPKFAENNPHDCDSWDIELDTFKQRQ